MRGINRQTIFEEDEDSEKFLITIKNCQEKSGYELYAYCLMGNHIHLLLKEGKEERGIIMWRVEYRGTVPLCCAKRGLSSATLLC